MNPRVRLLRFCTVGLTLPHCTGDRVLRLVSRTSLCPIKETHYALMSADEAIELRRDASGLKSWATLEHLTGARELERDLQLPDSTICFNCHMGWSDEATGPLLVCKGACQRAFHVGCHAHFPLETQTCGRCSGTDVDVCCVCDREWVDPAKTSDYYTGEMLSCDGPCGRWFHQQCHQPAICDAACNKKSWKCGDCAAQRASKSSGASRVYGRVVFSSRPSIWMDRADCDEGPRTRG